MRHTTRMTQTTTALAAVAMVLLGVRSGVADEPTVGTIETVAGGGVGDGGPATAASLNYPRGVAVDNSGSIFITDSYNVIILKVATDGTITTVAGGGIGALGDGGLATSARLHDPKGVAVDGSGNLFIADGNNNRIRKVNASGTITTVAGNGTGGFSGDSGAATSANLNRPEGVTVDASGNLFIADTYNHRIRKVDASGTITTVAGNGAAGFSGDGGAATSANFNLPQGVAVDGFGNLFIADRNNHRIRRVAPDGTITTVAGDGVSGFSGDGGAATSARLSLPSGVAVDDSGNLFVADRLNYRIRKVAADGTITTVAGNPFDYLIWHSGDGGAATSARLYEPEGVAVDGLGNLFIADTRNDRIRKVDASGTITTVAGGGGAGFSGDGGAATSATLYEPWGVEVDRSGNLFVADTMNQRVRRVSADGTINTVAGNGAVATYSGLAGDGGAAISASFHTPTSVAVDESGNLLIADFNRGRVRNVSTDGVIATVAGGGDREGTYGDGMPATSANLNRPGSVAVDGSGNLFITEVQRMLIRKVDASGTIITVAGRWFGFGGDGGPATSADLAYPWGIALDAAGNLFIADRSNFRIRKVDTNGTITTVAGTGSHGFSGDGGPATSAALAVPWDVAVDAAGNLFIAETGSNRVRKVDTNGTISTVAGSWGNWWFPEPRFSGDGGLATSARLNQPKGVAVDGAGNLYIADTGNHRIRRVWGVAARSGVTVTGAAAIAREADNAGGAAVPVLLQLAGTVPSGAELLVRDITEGQDVRTLHTAGASAGTAGFTSTFPIGTSTVIAEVRNGDEVIASFTFTVQINDTTAPTISGVEDRTVELGGPTTPIYAALLGITASDAGDAEPVITFSPSDLPIGTTTVTVTVRDASGNTTTDTFDVTIVDSRPPEFTVAPGPIAKDCTDGSGAATVVFDVQAVDLSGPVTITCTDEDGNLVDPAGTSFAVGDHVVTCVAADGSGNTSTYSFMVSIADKSSPVMILPADISVGTDAGKATAAVSFSVTASDDAGAVTITTKVGGSEVASGDPFPVGATLVTCTATDEAGNVTTGTFSILVRDDEAPVITAPSSITLVTDVAGNPMAVTPGSLGASATDNCDPMPVLSCSPSTLSPGTTTVTVTAVDADGNSSNKNVSVTILKGPFTVAVQKPVESSIDNRFKIGSTLPIKIKVTANGETMSGATAVIDEVVRIDGDGTPISQPIDDAGQSADSGDTMRYSGEAYMYNLKTTDWDNVSGARFRVTIRITMEGHADTLVSLVFVAQ